MHNLLIFTMAAHTPSPPPTLQTPSPHQPPPPTLSKADRARRPLRRERAESPLERMSELPRSRGGQRSCTCLWRGSMRVYGNVYGLSVLKT